LGRVCYASDVSAESFVDPSTVGAVKEPGLRGLIGESAVIFSNVAFSAVDVSEVSKVGCVSGNNSDK
jgi:hypothetical protein